MKDAKETDSTHARVAELNALREETVARIEANARVKESHREAASIYRKAAVNFDESARQRKSHENSLLWRILLAIRAFW